MGLSHEPEEREVWEGDDMGRGKNRGWGEDYVHVSLCSDSWVFSGMQVSKSVNFRFANISSRQAFPHEIWNGEVSLSTVRELLLGPSLVPETPIPSSASTPNPLPWEHCPGSSNSDCKSTVAHLTEEQISGRMA